MMSRTAAVNVPPWRSAASSAAGFSTSVTLNPRSVQASRTAAAIDARRGLAVAGTLSSWSS